jgi:hypothetical protein
MVAEITVNNSDEFQELVDQKDFRISKAIVDGILDNINSKKKHVHVLSITCLRKVKYMILLLNVNTLLKH